MHHFFNNSELNQELSNEMLGTALLHADDGELYLEHTYAEQLVLEDGRIKTVSSTTDQGFGLRAVAGEFAAYAYASSLTPEALRLAAQNVAAASQGYNGTLDVTPEKTAQQFYADTAPLGTTDLESRILWLQEMDAYTRAADPRIAQVTIMLAAAWRHIDIMRLDSTASDIRPMVRLFVSVLLRSGGKQETGGSGIGGRYDITRLMDPAIWQDLVKDALRQADNNLMAVPAPAGEMPVVMGPGRTAVLLHEAVGHGLEGDHNRKGASTYADKIGERVAAPGVTVVDDGTLFEERGSLAIDDEGTLTGRVTLIEDGILKAYMQDRMTARLMGQKQTGNGRRESYHHAPMTRMTNTLMLGGAHDPGDIIASVDKGIYIADMSGGQVEITSGRFVFNTSEAYLIENGKITAPVKGATLIGHGPTVLQRVSMIGNDFAVAPGTGTCGKAGQSVPVNLGQPSVKIDSMTVGGAQ